MNDQIIFLLAVLYVGAVIGSLINVIAHRLPRVLFPEGLDVHSTKPESLCRASSCPHCGKRIRWRHNIPVIGWLIVRGRCHDCQAPISVRYPIVELMVACGSVLIAWVFGPSMRAIAMIAVFWVLVTAALIDWDTFFLPDVLTMPLLWGGIFFSLYAQESPLTIGESLEGAAAGYAIPWLVNAFMRMRTGVDGLARGDCKFLAALGAWFGVGGLALIGPMALGAQMALHAAIGARPAKASEADVPAGAAPFGPGLAAAGIIMIFIPPQMALRIFAL